MSAGNKYYGLRHRKAIETTKQFIGVRPHLTELNPLSSFQRRKHDVGGNVIHGVTCWAA